MLISFPGKASMSTGVTIRIQPPSPRFHTRRLEVNQFVIQGFTAGELSMIRSSQAMPRRSALALAPQPGRLTTKRRSSASRSPALIDACRPQSLCLIQTPSHEAKGAEISAMVRWWEP